MNESLLHTGVHECISHALGGVPRHPAAGRRARGAEGLWGGGILGRGRRGAELVPEGDTVWYAARRLGEALAGRVAHPHRLPGAAVRHHRPDRAPGHRVAGARQAPADPGRGRGHRAHPPEDGRRLAGAPGQRAAGRRATGSGWCWATTPGRPSATSSASSRCCAPPGRPRWSATSARTCSARTGTPARRSAGCGPTRGRPIGEALLDQRNLAGIGNVYKSEVLFLRGIQPVAAGRRGGRTWTRWWTWRTGCSTRTRTGSATSPPAWPGAARSTGCTAGAAATAAAAGPSSAGPTRARAPRRGSPSGAQAASGNGGRVRAWWPPRQPPGTWVRRCPPRRTVLRVALQEDDRARDDRDHRVAGEHREPGPGENISGCPAR